MRLLLLIAILAGLVASAQPVAAQDVDTTGGAALDPGAGIEVFASTDADNTDIIKLTARALIDYDGHDQYLGIALEQAWFTPTGTQTASRQRAYLDIADRIGEYWRYQARIGSDGDAVLGSATIRKADWSTSFFVEREVVETRRGLDDGIYYTFIGASQDVSLSDRDIVSLMAGWQDFTGDNARLHLRGTYTHVLKEQIGLSAQLRARYYHSTEPSEADYYSPADYFEVLPVLRLRRFTGNGWMLLGAAGIGVQRDNASGWREARYANLRAESPRHETGWQFFGEATYTNTSISGGIDYAYVQGRMGLARKF